MEQSGGWSRLTAQPVGLCFVGIGRPQVRLVGLDVTQQLVFSAAEVDAFRQAGTAAATFVADVSAFYNDFHQVRAPGAPPRPLAPPSSLPFPGHGLPLCRPLTRALLLSDAGAARGWFPWPVHPRPGRGLRGDGPRCLRVVGQRTIQPRTSCY
jgi:hypothetical protein